MPQAVQNKALVDADDVNSAPISPVFWCNNALISPQQLCSQSLSLLFPPTNFHEKRCPARIRSYFPRLVANNAPISPGLFGSIRDNALISPTLGPIQKKISLLFPPDFIFDSYPNTPDQHVPVQIGHFALISPDPPDFTFAITLQFPPPARFQKSISLLFPPGFGVWESRQKAIVSLITFVLSPREGHLSIPSDYLFHEFR
jgi:hypothetical protein